MSKWKRSPIFLPSITSSDRFIDKYGNHPNIMDTIDGNKIVLSKEKLTDNNWLFCVDNDEEIIVAEKQINTLIFYKDWVLILS